MSLHIHRAERADRLADELGKILRGPLADPFAAEIVAVPTQGVERWLAQHLSHQLGTSHGGQDGVCAGVEFESLRRLATAAIAAVVDVAAEEDPWQPARSVWPLVAVIDRARGQEWASLLWSYLADRGQQPGLRPAGVAGEAGVVEPDQDRDDAFLDLAGSSRRWATARRLVELFTAYGNSRPEMVKCWLEGNDVDAAGVPLAPDRAWQAELWRRLRAAIGAPSPAERLEAACARLVTEPDASALPSRLSVFGPSRLAPEHRSVLTALAVHRDVHLWLPHPSPVLWQQLAESAGPVSRGPRQRAVGVGVPVHPLLAYLGRDSRELQLTLAAGGAVASDVHYHYLGRTGDRDPSPNRLLHQLQRDLSSDCGVRPRAERLLLLPDDRSLQIHSSHGPDRQVEVLREVLVGLLADDPTLEPRDIVVMCPDIETFAPLISASFGLHGEETTVEHPGHRLRVRLADRSLRQVNPLLATLSLVLALADSRMEASTLLDLCAFPPVAHRFAFSEDDLERLRDLVVRSGVRWGLSAGHRRAFQMGDFGQNTWAAGLDRLLLGITMDEADQHFLGTALPLDDVDSSDVELVGRLAEFLDRLRFLAESCRRRQPLTEWVALCRSTIELLTSVSASNSWQTSHAYAKLSALAEVAIEDGQPLLALAEVRALLSDTFRGRPSRANFRTGTLTICTMQPMRSVPHRVICLLGVDDGVFPRRAAIDGDDILAGEPWIGDRDPRSEDRQLLLDAIMAAQERLVVIYSGADARTRAAKPPAVPIGALLDTLDVTARTVDDTPVRDEITTRHPLQPFGAGNFTPGDRGAEDGGVREYDVGEYDVGEYDAAQRVVRSHGAMLTLPRSFDQSSLRGALATQGARSLPTSVFDATVLTPATLDPVIALPDLVRFFNHPIKALLRKRAGLYVGNEPDEDGDQIPVRLDGLQAWAIGERLLRLHLEGADLDRLADAEWRRGSLPPQTFGREVLVPVTATVRQIAEQARPYLAGQPQSLDVQVDLDGASVTGTLSTVFDETLVTVTYSKLAAKHRLQSWLGLLALSAGCPDRSWRAVTIGQGARSVIGPVPGAWAALVLADLVQLYRTGLDEPLPFAPRTAAEYAKLRDAGRSVEVFSDKLDKTWRNEKDEAYEWFFGLGVTWNQLQLIRSVLAEERGTLAEPSRFGTLARRVWHPLLSSEALS